MFFFEKLNILKYKFCCLTFKVSGITKNSMYGKIKNLFELQQPYLYPKQKSFFLNKFKKKKKKFNQMTN